MEDSFSVENLHKLVDHLVKSRHDVIRDQTRFAEGTDRIDWPLFDQHRDKHIRAISRKVLSDRYTFSPFLEVQIPKPESTEQRTISIASIRDVIVQSALYRHLYDAVDDQLHECVFGYRSGRSAHDAVRSIQGSFRASRQFVFDADLTKFFDRVDHERMYGLINRLGCDKRALKLIYRYLKTGRIPPEQTEEMRKAVGSPNKFRPKSRTVGVPQGGVLSGMLSNLYLAEFDAEIVSEFDGYVRYADDFVICCDSKRQCNDAAKRVRSLLPTHLVELNEDKTTDCVHADDGVDFLGFRIRSNRLSVRGRNIAKF